MEKVRLNLEVQSEVKEQMLQAQELTRSESITATLRMAVKLLLMFVRHVSNGGKVIFRNKDGSEETIKILL